VGEQNINGKVPSGRPCFSCRPLALSPWTCKPRKQMQGHDAKRYIGGPRDRAEDLLHAHVLPFWHTGTMMDECEADAILLRQNPYYCLEDEEAFGVLMHVTTCWMRLYLTRPPERAIDRIATCQVSGKKPMRGPVICLQQMPRPVRGGAMVTKMNHAGGTCVEVGTRRGLLRGKHEHRFHILARSLEWTNLFPSSSQSIVDCLITKTQRFISHQVFNATKCLAK
jgi:hypothetical protein